MLTRRRFLGSVTALVAAGAGLLGLGAARRSDRLVDAVDLEPMTEDEMRALLVDCWSKAEPPDCIYASEEFVHHFDPDGTIYRLHPKAPPFVEFYESEFGTLSIKRLAEPFQRASTQGFARAIDDLVATT